MRFIVRSFPVVSEVLVTELKDYLVAERFDERYPNFGIPRIDVVHPFASWIDRGQYDQELLPSVTVAAGTDQTAPEVSDMRDAGITSLLLRDVEGLTSNAFDVSEQDRERLRSLFAAGRRVIHGMSVFRQRQDSVNMEIWSDTPQIKNRLYNVVEGFAIGPRRQELWNERGLYIRSESISGQRDNNYNSDFGRVLYGGMVSMSVDYRVVETIYDSDWKTMAAVKHTFEGVNHGAKQT